MNLLVGKILGKVYLLLATLYDNIFQTMVFNTQLVVFFFKSVRCMEWCMEYDTGKSK